MAKNQFPSPRPAGGRPGSLWGMPAGTSGRPVMPFPLGGIQLWDDFFQAAQGAMAVAGDFMWPRGWYTAAPGTLTSVAATAAAQYGVVRLASANVIGTGAFLAHAVAGWFGSPPIGTFFITKLRIQGGLNGNFFSGWVTDPMVFPLVATATEALGFRSIQAGAATNWFFVSKNAGGAGGETTQDMGVLADGTWRTLGAVRRGDGSWMPFLLDASDGGRAPWATEVGAGISGTQPVAALRAMPMEVVTTANAVKEIDIDFIGYGGYAVR